MTWSVSNVVLAQVHQFIVPNDRSIDDDHWPCTWSLPTTFTTCNPHELFIIAQCIWYGDHWATVNRYKYSYLGNGIPIAHPNVCRYVTVRFFKALPRFSLIMYTWYSDRRFSWVTCINGKMFYLTGRFLEYVLCLSIFISSQLYVDRLQKLFAHSTA